MVEEEKPGLQTSPEWDVAWIKHKLHTLGFYLANSKTKKPKQKESDKA